MDINTNLLFSSSGMLIGLLLGTVIQRSRFCMTAVVSNWVLMRDTRQLHIYLIAVLVAIIGTLLLEQAGLVAIDESAYRHGSIPWISIIIGGCVFGLGAVFAGGCIGRILVLTGEGNLGALLALLTIALGATATYTGALESFRLWARDITALQVPSGDASILSMLGISSVLFLFVAIVLFVWLVRHNYRMLRSSQILFGAVSLGALVIVAWWTTGWLAMDEFSTQKPAALTFAGPIASSTLYLTIGNTPQNLFGITLFTGVIAGSFISAIFNHRFRLQAPEPGSILRILSGGILMGIGAMMAGGCNIGQGLTGMSTLSLQSIIAIVAIFAGMYSGVKWLQYGEEHGSLWAFLHLNHAVTHDLKS